MRVFVVFVAVISVGNSLWPKKLLRLPPLQFHDCLHAFWYCTDNISKWPDNETFCRQLFAACEENLPTPIQGKYKNHVTTSTTEAVQTTESIPTTTLETTTLPTTTFDPSSEIIEAEYPTFISAKARIFLDDDDPSNQINGLVTFEQLSSTSNIKISGSISGLPPGQYGLHVHQIGDLSNNCLSSGGHFNPFNSSHGDLTSDNRHAGDLSNIVSDDNGDATFAFVVPLTTTMFGRHSILGRTLVIHAGEDDLGQNSDDGSKKTGNAGPRLTCALIDKDDDDKESFVFEIKSYLEMLFCVCDLDGNSKLTFDEVNSEMCLFDSPPSEEEFYKADADNDREVTLEEALAISNSNSITFRRQLSYNGISGLKEAQIESSLQLMSCTCDKNKNQALTLAEIEQPFCQQFFPIVKEGGFEVLDTDNNGEVDESEIVGALRLGIVKRTTSCNDISPTESSNVFSIKINGEPKEVYCDMRSYGGGWTVIQRRGDYGNPENYFQRSWNEYKDGFGSPKKEFWIGLDALHELTWNKPGGVDMIITLEDFEGDSLEVQITGFFIYNETNSYELIYRNAFYLSSENPGYLDMPPNGTKFTTESLESCPEGYSGSGWWLDNCFQSNPNGLNLRTQNANEGTGIIWVPWHGSYYSLKSTEIKIKPSASLSNPDLDSSSLLKSDYNVLDYLDLDQYYN